MRFLGSLGSFFPRFRSLFCVSLSVGIYFTLAFFFFNLFSVGFSSVSQPYQGVEGIFGGVYKYRCYN